MIVQGGEGQVQRGFTHKLIVCTVCHGRGLVDENPNLLTAKPGDKGPFPCRNCKACGVTYASFDPTSEAKK